MMKRLLVIALVLLALLHPHAADAGIRSAMKKTVKTLGHVAENSVYVAVATLTVVLLAKGGAFN